MSIRKKTMLVLAISSFILICCLSAVSYSIFGTSVHTEEKRQVQQNINLIFKVINKDVASLNSICTDWAQWDDSYAFIEGKGKDFAYTNLQDSTLSHLKLNTMLFLDSSSNIVFGKGYDLENGTGRDFPEGLKEYVTPHSPILNHQNSNSVISGLILLKEGPMLISSVPITKNGGKGDLSGTLIIGRFLDSSYIENLEEIIGARITIRTANDTTGFYEFENAMQLSSPEKSLTPLKSLNDDFLFGYVHIKDFTGKDIMIARMEIPRSVYKQGLKAFVLLIFSFIICLSICILIAMLFTQKAFLCRLRQLNLFIEGLHEKEDISKRISIKGNDEISRLGRAVNLMLEKISLMNQTMRKSEERLNMVLEGTNDGYWDLDTSTQRIFLSPKTLSILECEDYEPNMDAASLEKVLNPDDFKNTMRAYFDCILGNTEQFRVEQRVLSKSVEGKWILIRGKVVEYDDDGIPSRMAGTVSDITEQKKAVEEITYLSFYDTLTGLNNRTYFEERLKVLDSEEYLPVSVILGDANGLKLANDTFGHKEGDNLLVSIARILKKSCRDGDLVARIGGDEFVVVLPRTGPDEAKLICERIRKNCDEANESIVKPNIALGAATKNEVDEDITKVLESAESRMYKNKLIEDKSARHSIIASMQRALFETDYETEEHAERLRSLAMKMSRTLNLPGNQQDELSLLATLHDIGKIAVPKAILNKRDILTPEEWEEVKKHPEIGYRIAVASRELATIAEGILTHHEKWDGTGYPKGLKGEKIPYLSRIISIIDAYDVMTHERPSKKAYSQQEAIEELRSCAGSHFDPELVEAFISMLRNPVGSTEICA